MADFQDWFKLQRDIFSYESGKLLGIFSNPRPVRNSGPDKASLWGCEPASCSLLPKPHCWLFLAPLSLLHTYPDNKLPWQIVVHALWTHIYIKLPRVRSGLPWDHLVNSYRHGCHKMTSSYWSSYPELTQSGTFAFTNEDGGKHGRSREWVRPCNLGGFCSLLRASAGSSS